MSLVWKLLRQHISIPQFIGFFFANLLGMVIVLLGIQFYRDVLPVFTADDSFMKSDFVILSKKIGTGNTISGRSNAFTASEIDELSSQPYVTKVGQFTRAEYKLDASMGVGGQSIRSMKNVIVKDLPSEAIVTQEMVDELMDENRNMSYPELEILNAATQEYKVDQQYHSTSIFTVMVCTMSIRVG